LIRNCAKRRHVVGNASKLSEKTTIYEIVIFFLFISIISSCSSQTIVVDKKLLQGNWKNTNQADFDFDVTIENNLFGIIRKSKTQNDILPFSYRIYKDMIVITPGKQNMRVIKLTEDSLIYKNYKKLYKFSRK
jgi:hypothetical protein